MATLRVCLICLLPLIASSASDPFSGGYLMIDREDPSTGKAVGVDELKALAENAATIPVNRVWIAFFSPTMVYEAGSHSLEKTGLGPSAPSFDELKNYTSMLQAGGVEVFLSMGGWDYNCYPYFYMKYSVGGYGQNTPNFWKIQQYAGGDTTKCVESNMYCYVCEPETEGTNMSDFSIFPEVPHSDTWNQAVQYVESKASTTKPVWHHDIMPGSSYTDPTTGVQTTVPGSTDFITAKRDPYQDIVLLAKDLGAAGVDLDYEEMWHADTFKSGSAPGPFENTQTMYKYVAIAKDIQLNIQKLYPACKLSTAAGAVGAWSGKWWGGNLKGIWSGAKTSYADVVSFMSDGANSGGINVMSYDLSDNSQFHECPSDDVCTLDKQVAFYMQTYHTAGINAAVGYEVGTPAYPDKTHDGDHQLPLTKSVLSSIVSQTQGQHSGGFLWELFKPVADSSQATPTDVAQAICRTVMPSEPRCKGTIPAVNGSSPSGGGNVCTPSSSCNVCDACCKPYLSDQGACDGCVKAECPAKNVCAADSTCTTCSACCKSYLSDQSACDGCVKSECGSAEVPRWVAERRARHRSLLPRV